MLATDAQADRARGRWKRHDHLLSLGGLVDLPLIYGQGELAALAGTSALTYDGVAFGGPRVTRDAVRTLQRPELDGGKIDTWQRLRGRIAARPGHPATSRSGASRPGSSSSTGGASRSRPAPARPPPGWPAAA